jgi:hypothetical protein
MKQHGARFTLVALTNLPLDGVSLIHRIPNISRESLSRPEFTTSVSAATGAVSRGGVLGCRFSRSVRFLKSMTLFCAAKGHSFNHPQRLVVQVLDEW